MAVSNLTSTVLKEGKMIPGPNPSDSFSKIVFTTCTDVYMLMALKVNCYDSIFFCQSKVPLLCLVDQTPRL